MNAIYRLFSVIAFLLSVENIYAYESIGQLLEEERFIKEYEGFSSKVYQDSNGQSVIGYGHKIEDSSANQTTTKQKSTNILEEDIRDIEALITAWVHVPLSQRQTEALVSLIYNWGEHNFLKSKGLEYLNQGNYDAAAHEFFSKERGVVNIAGKFSKGLYRRRQAELELWND